jgi:hypothetical protein
MVVGAGKLVEVVVCGLPSDMVVVVQGPRVVEVEEVVAPGMLVVVVVDGTKLVDVTGWHGTVVVNGLSGMQSGSVVEVVGIVGPLVPVVVVIPGADVVVVVARLVVVLEPGVGGPEHPNDCNRDAKMLVTCGKEANVAWNDRIAWQMGSRIDASSCATPTREPSTVCAPPIPGCRTRTPALITSHNRARRRTTRPFPPPSGPMPPSASMITGHYPGSGSAQPVRLAQPNTATGPRPVDELAQQVGVAVVAGVLLDHVHQHPPQRHRPPTRHTPRRRRWDRRSRR